MFGAILNKKENELYSFVYKLYGDLYGVWTHECSLERAMCWTTSPTGQEDNDILPQILIIYNY